MQDDQARGGGLQGGRKLIGGDFAGKHGADAGLQGLRGDGGRGGFGEHDDGNFGGEVGVR
jgi:hypothetical protein